MNNSAIVNSVFSLFMVMLVGVYGNRRNIITYEINKGLTDILLRICLPLFIISSFIFTYDESIKGNIIKALFYSPILFILVGGLSYLFLIPIKGDKKSILQFANVFTNSGYLGFPVLYAVYGAEAVLYASIFQLYYTVFIWTYGIMLFREAKFNKAEIKAVFLNSAFIAVVIGLIIMIFNIKPPNIILNSINMVGGITGPLSMLIVGAILSRVKIKYYLKDFSVYYGLAVKLIFIPAAIYLISLLFNERSMVINSLIVIIAMPAAIMTSIFAEGFNKEKEYATVIVFFTTICSIISLPILLKVLSL